MRQAAGGAGLSRPGLTLPGYLCRSRADVNLLIYLLELSLILPQGVDHKTLKTGC